MVEVRSAMPSMAVSPSGKGIAAGRGRGLVEGAEDGPDRRIPEQRTRHLQ